jgi:hypothetical protein
MVRGQAGITTLAYMESMQEQGPQSVSVRL